MSITVYLPTTLRGGDADTDTLTVTEPVENLAELVQVLDRRLPEFRAQWDDLMLNFAVNGEVVLPGARERALADGDVIEIVPAISGGAL